MRLEALEHLFFNVFDVGEPVPTSHIAVFTVTLKLQNEILPLAPAGLGIFPGDAACKCPPFVSAGSWFLIPYCAPNFVQDPLPPPIMLETFSRSSAPQSQASGQTAERDFTNSVTALHDLKARCLAVVLFSGFVLD
jgi:hypothetical protein